VFAVQFRPCAKHRGGVICRQGCVLSSRVSCFVEASSGGDPSSSPSAGRTSRVHLGSDGPTTDVPLL
jgi:hypothetical protein